MGIYATAGSKVYIGTPKAAQSAPFVASDFNGQSWVEIGWLESIGEFGDEANEVTFSAIGEGRLQTLKGTRNAGSMALVAGIDYDDDGQAALYAAEAEKFDYAFRVDFNDAPSGGTPSKRYFVAKVMSAREALDNADNVMKLNSNLRINSNVVRVPAAGP